MSKRIGSIGYATSQGLGHLLKDFYDHGIVDEVMLVPHPKNEHHSEWYPADTPVLRQRPFATYHHGAVDVFLSKVDTVLFFETPFDWDFLTYLRSAGKRSVLVPMYEWWPENPRFQGLFNQTICPSLLDLEYYRRGAFGICKGCFLQPPVDPGTWVRRERAMKFLHNAGHIGSRNHKGTLELLKALPLCRRPLDLTIRCQSRLGMDKLLASAGISGVTDVSSDPQRKILQVSHVLLTVEIGDLPRDQLFNGYDVYVAPEKYNGMSLPLQEAYASGMLVITTDRFPMNMWLPKAPLIPVSRTGRVRVSPGYLEIEESVISPEDIAECLDTWNGERINEYSYSGRMWAQEHSWDEMVPLWRRRILDAE